MSGAETIAVIGGTGALGSAIAGRLARAGRRVLIGSRSPERSRETAAELGHGIEGLDLAGAAAAADLIILTVPFAAQAETIAAIRDHVVGKIVVDTTVPLVPPKVARVSLPPEGSAAVRAQDLLGEGVTVVSGFHNVAAAKLAREGSVECDVLVFGDDPEARGKVVALAEMMSLRGLHGGSLANSAAGEALTSVLIFLNKTYKAEGAGIRLTGIPDTAA